MPLEGVQVRHREALLLQLSDEGVQMDQTQRAGGSGR